MPGTGGELLHRAIDVILCFISQNKADTLLLHLPAPERPFDHRQTRLRERQTGPHDRPLLGLLTLKCVSFKRSLMNVKVKTD